MTRGYIRIERLYGTADEPPPGNSGPSYSARPPTRRNAWTRHLPPHRANDGRDVSGESGLALSRPAPHGGERLAEVVLGAVRQQSSRPFLPTHENGRAAVGRRNGGMEADLAGDHPGVARDVIYERWLFR